MGQQTLSGTDISALREEYLQKVTEELPAKAQASSVTNDGLVTQPTARRQLL
jgi:hypothetical protein